MCGRWVCGGVGVCGCQDWYRMPMHSSSAVRTRQRGEGQRVGKQRRAGEGKREEEGPVTHVYRGTYDHRPSPTPPPPSRVFLALASLAFQVASRRSLPPFSPPGPIALLPHSRAPMTPPLASLLWMPRCTSRRSPCHEPTVCSSSPSRPMSSSRRQAARPIIAPASEQRDGGGVKIR